MFTIIQEFTEKYCGFRGSLFSIHPLSGCERLLPNGILAAMIVLPLYRHTDSHSVALFVVLSIFDDLHVWGLLLPVSQSFSALISETTASNCSVV